MSIENFKFQPGKIKTGNVYHYVKSNIDGSYPARIHIRVMDAENLDVWKFEEHNADAAHVAARMDWEIFSAVELRSSVVVRDGNESPRAVMSLNKADSSIAVQFGEMRDAAKVGLLPAHVYNFDFISLIFSLPHWTNPEGEVSVGIIQPNFNPEQPGFIRYEGAAEIRFISTETRNGINCRKYAIGGEGLQGQGGFFWVNPADDQVVDMEIPIPDNPDWDDFKIKLEFTRFMDDKDWKAFIDSQVARLNP